MEDTSEQTNLKTLVDSYRRGETEDFSLVLGGPLFQLLRKAHLEGNALELLHRRIFTFITLTWFPLLVLSMLGMSAAGGARISFFRDIEVHARFLLALPILIGAELLVHSRIRAAVRSFVEWRIVLPEDMPRFHRAIESAVRFGIRSPSNSCLSPLSIRWGCGPGVAGRNSAS